PSCQETRDLAEHDGGPIVGPHLHHIPLVLVRSVSAHRVHKLPLAIIYRHHAAADGATVYVDVKDAQKNRDAALMGTEWLDHRDAAICGRNHYIADGNLAFRITEEEKKKSGNH